MISRLGIRGKLLLAGVVLTLAPLATVAVVVYRQNGKMTNAASVRTLEMAEKGLDDIGRGGQPGYPAIGRLKGLAELRGVEMALAHGARA